MGKVVKLKDVPTDMLTRELTSRDRISTLHLVDPYFQDESCSLDIEGDFLVILVPTNIDLDGDESPDEELCG